MVGAFILVSLLLDNPLAVVDSGKYPLTTRCLSLTKVVITENAHLVMLTMTRNREYVLSADQSTYQLALSQSNNTIMAVHRDQLDQEQYKLTFKEESIADEMFQSRYYVECDGNKYYLSVKPEGVTTVTGSDLTTDDQSTIFRAVPA